MGQHKQICHTLPSSPTHHHHHASDFRFTISLSPPNSSAVHLRPADELFYNGQLLPLHLSNHGFTREDDLSPRNSMVHNLLTTTLRHSDHHSPFSSPSSRSRPSSATDDGQTPTYQTPAFISDQETKLLALKHKLSSAASKTDHPATGSTSSVKQKIRNYLKKLSRFHRQKTTSDPIVKRDDIISYSFSGNLRFLTRTSCVSSCPSTTPSSPNPAGVLCRKTDRNSWSSTTEELQSAIQGAIAHCKNSMTK